MRDQYHINSKYEKPDPNKVSALMDFEAVLKAAEEERQTQSKVDKKTKLRKLIVRVGTIAASLVILLWAGKDYLIQDYDTKQTAYFSKQQYASPPITDLAKPTFASYKVPAYQGATIEHQTGSVITVPQEAFVYENGEVVTGDVQIKYREMHDYIDFFLSGMDLQYDSLQQWNIESAGMVEIYAEQGGQRINMAPGKRIEVELISVIDWSADELPTFKVYQLNTSTKGWDYKGIDEIMLLENEPEQVGLDHVAYQVQSNYFDRLHELDQLEEDLLKKAATSIPAPVEPIRPTEQRPQGLVFGFDLKTQLKEAAPALYGAYRDALWQLHPSEQVSRAELDKTWEDLKLVQLNALDFKLTLISADEQKTILINPLLIGRAYEKAQANYRKQLANYDQAMQSWEQAVKARKLAIAENILAQKNEAQKQYKQGLQALETEENRAQLEALQARKRVRNRFSVDALGVWNCGKTIQPEAKSITARFKLPDGTVLNNLTGFITRKDQNSMQQFLVARNTPMKLDLSEDYLIWLILPNQKIAIVKPTDLAQIQVSDNRQEFILELVDETKIEEHTLRQVLSFI